MLHTNKTYVRNLERWRDKHNGYQNSAISKGDMVYSVCTINDNPCNAVNLLLHILYVMEILF